MGLFGFGKKDKVLDLTEGYKRKVSQAEEAKKAQAGGDSNPFSFFDSPGTEGTEGSEMVDLSDTPEERKRKLAKRIADMTERVEDLSNQLYHLQQRLEVLERKNEIRRV